MRRLHRLTHTSEVHITSRFGPQVVDLDRRESPPHPVEMMLDCSPLKYSRSTVQPALEITHYLIAEKVRAGPRFWG